MGLIKNIFGAIFGVIKAIFGIFGLGKKSEYFLEADNSESSSKPQAQPQAAAKEEKPAAPAAKESAPAPAAATKAEAPAADQAKATPAPKPVPVEPKPEPVGNFATDYLMAPSANMGRRRPGPSLSPFKDLAKDMKLPSGAR
jgi:cytoskeletal protein RodZ